MFSHAKIWAVWCFALVLLLTGCPSTQTFVNVDDSTPESTLRAFYMALVEGDSRTASFLLLDPRGELVRFTRIQAQTSNAFRRFGSAGVSQFGEEGKSLDLGVPAELPLRKLDIIKPDIDETTAEWAYNPDAPLKLKRIEGHWKIDLYSSFPVPDHLQQINDRSEAIVSLLDELASDIESGKFKSVTEVRVEMKRRRQARNIQLGQFAF